MKPLSVQLLLIREILTSLNEAFSPNKAGIPTSIIVDGKLKAMKVKEDPYFVAYKTNNGWRLMCTNYFIWRDNYAIIKEFCDYFVNDTGVDCFTCQGHVVAAKMYKDYAKQKIGGVQLFVGQVSWAA